MPDQKSFLKQAGTLLCLSFFSLHFLGNQRVYSTLPSFEPAVAPSFEDTLSEHTEYAEYIIDFIGQDLQRISEDSLFQQSQENHAQIAHLFDSILEKASSCFFHAEHTWSSFLLEIQHQEETIFIPLLQELKEKVEEIFSLTESPSQNEASNLSFTPENRAHAFQQALSTLQKGVSSLFALASENRDRLSLSIPSLLHYKSSVYTWKKRLELLKGGNGHNTNNNTDNCVGFFNSFIAFLDILDCEMNILLGNLQQNQKEQNLKEIDQNIQRLQTLQGQPFSLSDFFTIQLFSPTPIESEKQTLQIEKDSLLYNVVYLSQNLKKILSYYQIR